ncbi:MAG: polyribonucleotide nucleotidyltransferase [Bacillota bacterium]
MVHKFEYDLAGRPLVVESGELAAQAGGSVLIRYGDTVCLVAATASKEPRQGVDFFPLTVDYEERSYAIGKIPGSVFRREGRPTEKAILTARLTDRPLRPLFPEGFRNDVQVVTTVLSVDHDNPPELCSIIGASAALSISDIPFAGPVGAVMVGLVGGDLVLNPTRAQAAESSLHLIVAGTRDAVIMVEAGADEVSEETMLEAIMFAHKHVRDLVGFQEGIAHSIGVPKRQVALHRPPEELERAVREHATARLAVAVMNEDKLEREVHTAAVMDETRASIAESFPEQSKDVDTVLHDILKELVRDSIVRKGRRPDGRSPADIRQVSGAVGLLRKAHGTGLFTRGQTQVLTIATLGCVGDVQRLFDLSDEEFKRYMHHYNFPPYSVGETRPLRGPGRREIGHGALAERALEPVLPDEEDFPYTIRLVSEVLASNGSTSMASVCGSTLALMDAGVPIKAPVAGVAMGLVQEGDRVAVLSDIQGLEDHLGDMDFKVAGTEHGITALQMDIKSQGVTESVLRQALSQAKAGRLHILGKMLEVIPAPRPELSPYAPRIIVLQIDPDKIREVIGPGGKVINKIIAETDVQIDIEDDGRIFIASVDEDGARRAVEMIQNLTQDVELGRTYRGKVMRLMTFGAFVEILPGKEGLVRIGELTSPGGGRIERIEDVVKVGDELTVKVIEIDRQGRINLSQRAAGGQPAGPGADPQGPELAKTRGPSPLKRRRGNRR